jgi:hypothetical protein
MHYTISNLPDEIDRALRAKAEVEKKPLEAIIVDLIANGLHIKPQRTTDTPLQADDAQEGVFGTDTEAILREQNCIDWEQWWDGVKRRDLTGIAGRRLITPEMKAVFAEQRRVDPELWK